MIEPGSIVTTRDALALMGHAPTLEAPDNAFCFVGAQLIARQEKGIFAAGSEPRKDGQAVGV